jgi:hypothetical protein
MRPQGFTSQSQPWEPQVCLVQSLFPFHCVSWSFLSFCVTGSQYFCCSPAAKCSQCLISIICNVLVMLLVSALRAKGCRKCVSLSCGWYQHGSTQLSLLRCPLHSHVMMESDDGDVGLRLGLTARWWPQVWNFLQLLGSFALFILRCYKSQRTGRFGNGSGSSVRWKGRQLLCWVP